MTKKPTYEDLERRIRALEKGKDVSERIDPHLKSPEAIYRLMLESISDTIIVTDDQGSMVYVCPNTKEIFGLSQDEVYSLNTIQKLISGSICDISDLKEKGELKNLEWTIKDANGKTRFLLINVQSVNIDDGTILYVMRDISDRRRDEENLERYRNIVSSTPDGISLLDKNYRYVIVNDAYQKFFGVERKNSLGLTVSEYLGKEVFEKHIQPNFEKCMQGETICYQEWFEYPTVGKRFVDITYYPYRSGGNKITGVVANTRDITSQKLAEEALRESERKLKFEQKIGNIGGWSWKIDSDIAEWSEQVYKIFKAPRKVASYELAKSLVHPDDLVKWENTISHAVETKEPFRFEYRAVRSDGKIIWVHNETETLIDEKGEFVGYRGIVQDITERKRLEDELIRAKKLESVGLLAGGIAHDFNNILTVILGNVSMAKRQVASEDEIFEMLNDAEMASVRAQTLTKQLLTFAKGGAPVRVTTSIKNLLKESSSFALRGSNSTCEFSIAKDLWPVDVDIGQMSQVINNIMTNSNQALPEGGIIQVAAENLIIEDTLGIQVKPGRHIKISITDQGVGILEKHLLKIFDPYFSTKHKGSGFGLAITYSIIKKHDGHITAESQVGVGTTFHIYLPASDRAVPEKEEVKLIKGQGKILVMDDEVSLRKIVGKILEKLGYETEFAKNGAEAIKMYQKAKEAEKPYVAAILDLTIPGGMGGKEAIKNLLEIDPEIKAIVCSGYSDDPVLANFQEYGFKGMMSKPFESGSLGKVLQEVLKGEK